MTDGETRFHLLSMCNTLRDHLIQTEKLMYAVEMLLARDPELRAWYEAEQKQEHTNASTVGPDELSAERILLRLQQEIQALGGSDRA